MSVRVTAEIEQRIREVCDKREISLSDWIRELIETELSQLPPPEVTRWFGCVPDLELPTRGEPWSKEEG
ncbi:MAG: hypothetical protein ABUS57_04795 [Pseudomonadota bacterium]